MGDGSLHRFPFYYKYNKKERGRVLTLHTQGFTEEENSIRRSVVN